MPIEDTLKGLCDEQITALKTRARGKEESLAPHYADQSLREMRIAVDPSNEAWLFVSTYEEEFTQLNEIKVFIPLQDWQNEGLKLANHINEKCFEEIAAIKTINPIHSEGLPTQDYKERPICLYFYASTSLCEIAVSLYEINQHLLTAVQDTGVTQDPDMKFCRIQAPPLEEQKIRQILKKIARIENYIHDREGQTEYKTWYGTYVGAYTKDDKIFAAIALKKAILEHTKVDEIYLGPLSQGELGDIFRECQDTLPFLKPRTASWCQFFLSCWNQKSFKLNASSSGCLDNNQEPLSRTHSFSLSKHSENL